MTDRSGPLPLNHNFQALDALDQCIFCKVLRRKVTRLAKGAPVRGQSRKKEVDKAEYSQDGEAWSEAFIGCLGRRARDEKRAEAMKASPPRHCRRTSRRSALKCGDSLLTLGRLL